jgi:hemoglobin
MHRDPRWLPLVLVALSACATAPAASSGTEPEATPSAAIPAARAGAAGGASLYQRIGGRDVIDAFVASFVTNVGRDPRIQLRFLFTDLDALRGHLSTQICEASGGPCKYVGRPMKSGHAGMRIKDAEFDAMAEDLVAALKAHGIAEREQKELLAAIGSLRPDIVEGAAP